MPSQSVLNNAKDAGQRAIMVGRRNLSWCLCVALLMFIHPLLLAAQASKQHILSSKLLVRNATVSDAAGVTTVILAAFDHTPQFQYMYQFQDDYPEEHFNCTYTEMLKFFDLPSGVGLMEVVDMPRKEPPHDMIPVAVAVWVLPSQLESEESLPLLSPLGLLTATTKCSHRDLNLTRFNDFQRQFNRKKRRYLDDLYGRPGGPNQLYLNTLGTHPDYQRRGAGGALVRSGLQFGAYKYSDTNVTATLIATAAGEPVYEQLGWDSLKHFTVKSLDNTNGTKEEWKYDVMKYDF